MNNNKTIYADKAMSRVAVVGVNSVGWVINPQSNLPEIRIFVPATDEWITAEEHKKRKEQRRIEWFQKRHFGHGIMVLHHHDRRAERALQI